MKERLELVKRLLELELQTAGNLCFNFGAHHGIHIADPSLAGTSVLLVIQIDSKNCINHNSSSLRGGGVQVKVAAGVQWGRSRG